jgi:predicted NACHT family NTPase
MSSSRISPENISLVKDVVKRTKYSSQQHLATELGISLSTLSNFLNGRPVDQKTFIDICERLSLDWQKYVEGQEKLPENIFEEYKRKYVDRYGKVKLTFSGMRESVPLEQIYTSVHFLNHLSIGRFSSIEALEKEFRKQPRRLQAQERCTQDGMTIANNYPFLMVLGAPGAGKSTYLRRIGLEALRGRQSQFHHECIPVMLELKRFDGERVDIKSAIVSEFRNVGIDFPEKFVESALQKGQLLILLDGLDEVPKVNQNKLIQAIQDFVTRYAKKDRINRFIVSCRIAAFYSGLTGFTDIELADFDDEQIQQFINNWFQSPLDQTKKTAEKFWTLLNDANYQSVKELAHTPLLLTFLCVVYDRTQAFPSNRASLYRKALDILLEEWAAEKRIWHEPIYKELNTELEKILLAEIACRGFIKNQFFFTREELVGHIQEFLEDSAEKPKYLDSKAVLTAIAMQQGILVERAEDIYSFSHLTVQEYLTAQHLSQNLTALAETVSQHLTEERWREVLLLIPGLLPNADIHLKWMETIAQQRICSPKLQSLLDWANHVTVDSANPVSSPSNRLMILVFSLALENNLAFSIEEFAILNSVLGYIWFTQFSDALDLAIDLAFVLSPTFPIDRNHVRELAFTLESDLAVILDLAINHSRAINRPDIINRSIDFSVLIQDLESLKSKVPDSKQPFKVLEAFSERLLQIWCKDLGLKRELLNHSESEVQALVDYFYICELIVRCKESAVRVSRDVWESIENAMVKPMPDSES